MSTETPRVGLYKPESGENVNVTTDLNNNLDKIDTNLNFRVVANATARDAIDPIWEGLTVRETDTGRCYVSNGSSPTSGSWDEILLITSAGIELASDEAIVKTSGTSTDPVITSTMVGSPDNMFTLQTDGRLSWGSGASGAELHLYRSTTDTLRLLGNMIVDDSLTVGGVGFPAIVYKTADTSRASTTTFTDDPDLTMLVEAGGTYLVEFNIMYEGGATGKFKARWTVPTGTIGVRGVSGPGSLSNDTSMDNVNGRFGAHNFDTDVEYGVRGTTGFESMVSETGVIQVTNTGTLALSWTQVASDVTPSRVTTGSWLRVTRLV